MNDIAVSNFPDALNAFNGPLDITLDNANNRALVTNLGSIVAVDLTSGARTILSDGLASPWGITLDSANNRALVTDDNLDAVFAVDLVNGQRVVLSR